MERLERCTFNGCNATVRAVAMPDHWVIAQHYSPNLPARSVRYFIDPQTKLATIRRAS